MLLKIKNLNIILFEFFSLQNFKERIYFSFICDADETLGIMKGFLKPK